MGRPPKAPQDRHSAQLNIPLKPADYARLRTKADKAETTVTDFVRASALGQKFTVVQSNNPDFDTIEQLRRIGVNLNQIAKAMNQGNMVPPPSIERAVSKLENLLTKWLVDDTSHDHRPKL